VGLLWLPGSPPLPPASPPPPPGQHRLPASQPLVPASPRLPLVSPPLLRVSPPLLRVSPSRRQVGPGPIPVSLPRPLAGTPRRPQVLRLLCLRELTAWPGGRHTLTCPIRPTRTTCRGRPLHPPRPAAQPHQPGPLCPQLGRPRSGRPPPSRPPPRLRTPRRQRREPKPASAGQPSPAPATRRAHRASTGLQSPPRLISPMPR
jgi:hypothetical protein